ncbi:MAG TPA: UDP-N-acetylmuramoyl-L-alanyl-D-glutamate--2,6-diaminopimelate ligase, partial [Prolixibacteraceae bacterium]|nr:UDP-N-acetylmuramoyl-L-alanyl-D-glutamate--2,6-diaminopimelate ligase [Prolixibacteraceae bacterium]
SGLAFDSRKVEPGFIFFAIKGVSNDGHQFIDVAVSKGATVVVCEVMPEPVPVGVTFVLVANSMVALGKMASKFYGEPSKKMKLVGITGTNGKTTTVTLLYRLMNALGHKAGLISTIRYMVFDEELPASHTTPDQLQLNQLMGKMVDAGCDYCFMEVSSHSIDQNRIAGLDFDGAIFSNITHDHLDYHKTFDAYIKAKKKFFDELKPEAFAITNVDDKNGNVMLQNTKAKKITYSLRGMADHKCKILESHFDGTLIMIDGAELWTHFVGKFNAYNLLAVYSAALSLGFEKEDILKELSNMQPVDGRFEVIRSSTGIYAIVDYAHTPDALKNVLSTINDVRSGNVKLICVVGAGGDRDKTKRPEMAAIACELSDKIILTSDNPRTEDPLQILKDMEAGVNVVNRKKVLTISDRREAIKTASMLALPGDIILIAGKGHEPYQEIMGVKYHFDDREEVKKIFEILNL